MKKNYFTFIGSPQDIRNFFQEHSPGSRLSGTETYVSINDDIDVNGAGGYGAVPSVVLREDSKPESIKLYAQLRKVFRQPEKNVVLHYLGPEFL